MNWTLTGVYYVEIVTRVHRCTHNLWILLSCDRIKVDIILLRSKYILNPPTVLFPQLHSPIPQQWTVSDINTHLDQFISETVRLGGDAWIFNFTLNVSTMSLHKCLPFPRSKVFWLVLIDTSEYRSLLYSLILGLLFMIYKRAAKLIVLDNSYC